MGELSVKVGIANRSYPLRIQQEEEQEVMQAAKQINTRIKEMEDNYAVKDKQDLLAMCALQMLTENKDHHKEKAPGNHIKSKLAELDVMLNDYLEANDE